ncbi:MAG: Gfo/Idh/MocA family oxidoreductase [Clostridiales bacterium]|jgi:hypothetical protein|nr:Gfo/Idh/MocA family oxidoreductase [Clostridiales bacterium]
MQTKRKIKIGLIGLGGRGNGLLTGIFNFDDVEVVAVCDRYEDRVVSAAQRVVDEVGCSRPFATRDYRKLLKTDADVVVIAAAWEAHAEIAVASMRAGKTVGLEVGGAYDVQSCWDMVDCYEKTKTPFMFLENCCYNKDELLAAALARNGLLGEPVFCSGSYCHDLREEIANGTKKRHYRLANYLTRNCENYPTHELGPICKILNINRGNRLVSLVSMSGKAAGMKAYIAEHEEYRAELGGKEFAQGDVVTTMIKCENGETILIKLDTTLPCLYDRGLTVSGTKGFYNQTTNSVILDDGRFNHETTPYKEAFGSQERYSDYLPGVWRNITPEQLAAGHGGMDYIMLKHFFQAVRNREEMPIDVYDAAVWMSVTALSALSIADGSRPVEVPDFTRGSYKIRAQKDVLPLMRIK